MAILIGQLVKSINKSALVVQLAPISSNARIQLHSYYTNTNGEKLAIPKMNVKSHGNGAVLINGRALPFLQRHLGKWIHNRWRHIHLLSHPHATRPVADKWLYACIPANRCWVCTYPIFCLEDHQISIKNMSTAIFSLQNDNTRYLEGRQGIIND